MLAAISLPASAPHRRCMGFRRQCSLRSSAAPAARGRLRRSAALLRAGGRDSPGAQLPCCAQVAENLRALEVLPKLTPEVLDQIEAVMQSAPDVPASFR